MASMSKSFIDRLFPHTPAPALPQYEQAKSPTQRSLNSPITSSRIGMKGHGPWSISETDSQLYQSRSASNISASPESKLKSLSSVPLSASVLHHDDPFLPIERAARALQENIQFLLDIQSRELSKRSDGIEQDDATSRGSLTPTQSVASPRSSLAVRTVPIRQPVKRKTGLRGARKGLTRKLREFAELKEHELKVLDEQNRIRVGALERVKDLEARRNTCTSEIESIRHEDASTTASNLRSEAGKVKSEIEELEHKLLELRVRHRHLLDQADQLESSLESKMSSFQAAVAMIDKDCRNFLKRPPVPHALADGLELEQQGMYALNPERRTLEMAKGQWTAEQETLALRRRDVEKEHDALLQGEQIWSEAVQYIDSFENKLRAQTKQLSAYSPNSGAGVQLSMDTVLHELDAVIEKLESDLSRAESNDWNLLICAVGAELEAFHQAREILQQTQHIAGGSYDEPSDRRSTRMEAQSFENSRDHGQTSPARSTESNESLKDTLTNFPVTASTFGRNVHNVHNNSTKYESEDDEPPADFLLSR